MMQILHRFRSTITNTWFFQAPKPYMRYLLVFVQGDSLVIIPFFFLVLLFGFFSIDFMLVLVGLFVTVRSFGEMLFWMLQQFGPHSYRPYDFGLSKLDNNAIYILYQLLGLSGTVLGAALVILVLYF
ncbi:MAG: hypothetical protein N2691_03650 [Patescibacteria group bacterium]|nr:hypothetical protein [Patescibacteria group bacterium]